MAIDPRIPTTPEQRASGFHRPGGRCVHHALGETVRCSASRMMGGKSVDSGATVTVRIVMAE